MATTAFAQTQIVARLVAREVVKALGMPVQPDDPDSCIVLPAAADPRKLWIMAGVVRWNLRRALVGALDDERVTAACGNERCMRADHLRLIHLRAERARGRSGHTLSQAGAGGCGREGVDGDDGQDDGVQQHANCVHDGGDGHARLNNGGTTDER